MSQPPYQPGEDEFAENVPIADEHDPDWDVPLEPTSEPVSEPLARLDELQKIAHAAMHICQQNSYQRDAKTYLKVEAWNGIAWLCGMILGTEPTVDKVIAGVAGIAARSTLKTAAGKLLSQAEGFVGQDEQWWTQPVSDRINIAQTRAVGRTCRHILSIVVTTMNHQYGTKFEVTPYEELQRASQPDPNTVYGGTMVPPPQLGVRHVMPSQPVPNYQPPQGPPQTTVYPNPAAYPQPLGQQQPNVAQPVGQQQETWIGIIVNVESKTNDKGTPWWIIHLGDGHNASTYNKTISGNAIALYLRNVEMIVIPRGKGWYNVKSIRPL